MICSQYIIKVMMYYVNALPLEGSRILAESIRMKELQEDDEKH